MATETQLEPAVLNEAAAIVEAEWMRLNRDQRPSDGELTGPVAEVPAPQRCPPRGGTVTAVLGRPGPPRPDDRARRARGPVKHRVWPTQRSPPSISPTRVAPPLMNRR